jgi:hypothetical protein
VLSIDLGTYAIRCRLTTGSVVGRRVVRDVCLPNVCYEPALDHDDVWGYHLDEDTVMLAGDVGHVPVAWDWLLPPYASNVSNDQVVARMHRLLRYVLDTRDSMPAVVVCAIHTDRRYDDALLRKVLYMFAQCPILVRDPAVLVQVGACLSVGDAIVVDIGYERTRLSVVAGLACVDRTVLAHQAHDVFGPRDNLDADTAGAYAWLEARNRRSNRDPSAEHDFLNEVVLAGVKLAQVRLASQQYTVVVHGARYQDAFAPWKASFARSWCAAARRGAPPEFVFAQHDAILRGADVLGKVL